MCIRDRTNVVYGFVSHIISVSVHIITVGINRSAVNHQKVIHKATGDAYAIVSPASIDIYVVVY